jgi:hypothetical protein
VVVVEGRGKDTIVYFRAVDERTVASRLLAWHPARGAQEIICEEPAYTKTYPNGAKVMDTRRYAVAHGTRGMRIVSGPDFTQAYDEQTYVVTVRGHGAHGPVEREIVVPGAREPCSSPLLVTPDGSRVFVQNFRGMVGFDLDTGEYLGTLRPEPPESPRPGACMLSPDGSRLYIDVYPQAILVRDTSRSVWSARLRIPEPLIAPGIAASMDNRWVAATPFRSTANGMGPFVHELLLYDLGPSSAAQHAPDAVP